MKKIFSLILVLVLFFNVSALALAEPTNVTGSNIVSTDSSDPEGSTRAEETGWIYRVTDTGLLQRRLWSYTYGKWLTDWITIGYVNPNP